MNSRDDDLTDIPQMKPARDEVVNRRPGSGASTRARKPEQDSRGGGGVWTVLSLLVAIAALGASYFLWEQSRQTQIVAEQAEKRIAELESQLTNTGDELTQSDAAVRVKLNELDSEVRKLWDSRKKAMALSDEHDKTIRNLVTRTDETRKRVDSAVTRLTVVSAELDEVVDMLDKADFENQAAVLKQSGEKLRSVERDISELKKRVVENEEWIESINAFRRQVNERLNPASATSTTPQLR